MLKEENVKKTLSGHLGNTLKLARVCYSNVPVFFTVLLQYPSKLVLYGTAYSFVSTGKHYGSKFGHFSNKLVVEPSSISKIILKDKEL